MTEDHVEDEPNIGLLCFIVYRAMEARVLADLAAAGFGDTTAAQGRVFARIDPDGTRLTDLAERALITKQTAGFLVDQLERAGYVRRFPIPATLAPGWYRSLSAAGPRSRSPGRPRPRSRPNGPRTWARRPPPSSATP